MKSFNKKGLFIYSIFYFSKLISKIKSYNKKRTFVLTNLFFNSSFHLLIMSDTLPTGYEYEYWDVNHRIIHHIDDDTYCAQSIFKAYKTTDSPRTMTAWFGKPGLLLVQEILKNPTKFNVNPNQNLIIDRSTLNTKIKGKYIHKSLVPNLIHFINPSFGQSKVCFSDQFNPEDQTKLKAEYETKIAQMKKNGTKILKKLINKILNLMKKMKNFKIESMRFLWRMKI